jgi:FkbH-like protein
VDVKSWLQAGFPYRLHFASALAERIAAVLFPAPALKGIITDLDDTLWSGILGEVGVDTIHWDLDHGAGHHGMYQRFLRSLAEDGILLAIASKNDRSLVEPALLRSDLLLPSEFIFPVEAHWQPKAESVERILRRWNIGADAVVFIDDSPIEVESVQARFPSMTCRRFPAEDPDAVWSLLEELRSLSGKAAVHEEDAIRMRGLRVAAEISIQMQGSGMEDILKDADAELAIVPLRVPPDPRALELINKTNQFNLNGARYTEAEWLSYLQAAGSAAWIVSYSDRFGPLGKVAVIAGRQHAGRFVVGVWVMSCRAFSRRIEHAVTDFLLHQPSVDALVLTYTRTERNTPLREYLEDISGGAVEGGCEITLAAFDNRKPALYMKVSTGA